MKFLNNIRKALAKSTLAKIKVSTLEISKTLAFDSINTIAILANIKNAADEELIIKYISYLKDFDKTVTAILYFDNNIPIDNEKFPNTTYITFNNKDLNFNYTSKSNWQNKFIETNYDLLINADIVESYPLHFLFAKSSSHFKIGSSNNFNKKHADILIELNEEYSLKYFLKHTDHYLQLINKHE